MTIGSSTNPVFVNLPNTVSGGGQSISVMNIGSGASGIVTVDGCNYDALDPAAIATAFSDFR